ncbi:zinc ribbon domain-containing protein [uncultured Methanobrevibacter sp.]|uniref:zinc ribbon domain-containing protein n=1 Tax=uncultured Methanobrevibacter sp. TaxID=253161 RepID=UPI0025DED474|nr:zinc ribbon domain-containing protein [uncultured Methanobrevibacter sp.]
MKCPECGKIYNDNVSKFCTDCGVKLIKETNEVTPTMIPTIDPEKGSLDTQLVNQKISEYSHEAKLADRVYKSYVTNGISRLDKINGRFLASQTVKLDVLIEQNKQLIQQNDKIIELLEKISEK